MDSEAKELVAGIAVVGGTTCLVVTLYVAIFGTIIGIGGWVLVWVYQNTLGST